MRNDEDFVCEVWWERKVSAWVRAKVVVHGSSSLVKARTESRMVLSIGEDGAFSRPCRRLRERRPRVPVCLARKPEWILCLLVRAGFLSLVWFEEEGMRNDKLWSPSLFNTKVPSGSMALEIQSERLVMGT